MNEQFNVRLVSNTYKVSTVQDPLAESAYKVYTQKNDLDISGYIAFVDSNNANPAKELLYTNTGLRYNPSAQTFSIGSSLNLSNNSISTGSSIFFIGTNYATGITSIGGSLKIGNDKIISSIGSTVVGFAGSDATFESNVTVKNDLIVQGDIIGTVPQTGPAIRNILYVTKDGNDSNSGLKPGDAKATIKAAVAIASEGTTIEISPGTYIEDNPVTIPDQVSFSGSNLREVSIQPLNSDKDLFYWGSGNQFENVSFYGTMPGKAVFSFDPSTQRYINQSPYVRNCTNFIPQSIGMRIDGNDVIGPLKSMVVDSYTQYNQGGIGVSITNSAYAQLVSIFTICDNIAIYCGSGGACDLTNSNSSFGTYGMIADGVSPIKYVGIITATAGQDSDTFDVDLSTQTFNVVNAIYNNTTGITTIYTDLPHQFNVGMGVSIVGLGFTCNTTAGILTYPSGQKGYTFEVKSVAPGRYLDASNSIIANRQEIIDKSLASVAIAHTNFYFPGDTQTNSRSRYFDAYRLIQKNKQEIVDKSLASIAAGFPSSFTFPDDPVPYNRNRYYDASGLIQQNKSIIVDLAWTDVAAAYPSISGTGTTCKRDLGFFVDAIATDVFTGGNRYSRDFSNQYINGAGAGSLIGEEQPTIYAFEKARDYMKNAITNTLVGAAYSNLNISTGSSIYGSGGPVYNNNNSGSCFDVQSNLDNLVGIITTVIGAGNTISLGSFNENVGISSISICARDLGYLVDAVSTDIFTGGNKYSRDFTKFYFTGNAPSGIGTTERTQSVYSFNSLRDFTKKAITNQLNYKEVGISSGPSIYGGPGIAHTVYLSGNPDSCADVQTNIDNLVGIVTYVIGTSNPNYLTTFNENMGEFTEGSSKCARDLGYIVDALSSDLKNYTNKETIRATKAYFNKNGTLISNGLVGELIQSITAFNAVRDYSKLAINNKLNSQNFTLANDPLTGTNNSENSCANVKSTIDNLVGILTTNLGNQNLGSLPNVSLASTQFTVNVGISTLAHYYNSGGTVKCDVIRPFDGQVLYFNQLYYDVESIIINDGGSGYSFAPSIIIEDPDSSWGVAAQVISDITNGVVDTVEIVSSGRGYTRIPRITVDGPSTGIATARLTAVIRPTYYSVAKSTPIGNNKYRVVLNESVPDNIGIGTIVPFFKQSRILASGHSFQYIGAGDYIDNALPWLGGVPVQENETISKNGGLVVYTSTDQSGNFRIGDGVVVNQNTGTVSGSSYTKSLFSTLTPFILALGGD